MFQSRDACSSLDQAGKETLKPIEEIEVGDKVLVYDEETGEKCYKEVVRLSATKHKSGIMFMRRERK